MTKVLSRQISHDGSLTVGQVVPNDYLPHTNWKTNDGKPSTTYWMRHNENKMEQKLSSLAKKEKALRSQRIKEDKQIIQQRLKEYRERGKPGAKVKLTDEQAIYCRQQCKLRSLQSLADEFKVSRQNIERCVKGLTFKHLNDKEKPQW